MADNETPPIVVGENAANLDTLMALGRYIGVIFATFPLLLAVVKRGDLAEIFDWVRGNEAAPLVSAVTSLALMGWGLWKTRHRGKQVVAVAASPEVPARIADLKAPAK